MWHRLVCCQFLLVLFVEEVWMVRNHSARLSSEKEWKRLSPSKPMPGLPIVGPRLPRSGRIAFIDLRIKHPLGHGRIQSKIPARMHHLDFIGDRFFASNNGLFILGICLEEIAVTAHFLVWEFNVGIHLDHLHSVQFPQILPKKQICIRDKAARHTVYQTLSC